MGGTYLPGKRRSSVRLHVGGVAWRGAAESILIRGENSEAGKKTQLPMSKEVQLDGEHLRMRSPLWGDRESQRPPPSSRGSQKENIAVSGWAYVI